ncbi:hypothetical protein, partial [Novosphingobium sp. PhB165]|uniref:hypothetical protein n=1 Tax=Novosphingobium sp. PhB165 TaxID=2485105 RepID=UPI001A9D3388
SKIFDMLGKMVARGRHRTERDDQTWAGLVAGARNHSKLLSTSRGNPPIFDEALHRYVAGRPQQAILLRARA